MIKYDVGTGGLRDWVVAETPFCARDVRKFESILSQGNGYMGIRAAAEEDYERTDRCALVAGTFDAVEEKNSTELPNSADVTAARIAVDGRKLRLDGENHSRYLRTLNLKNGLLRRSFCYKGRSGVLLECCFERFVSLADRHVMGERIRLRALSGNPEIAVETGIAGGTRSGAAHFVEPQASAEGGIWQYAEKTHESGIEFVTSAAVTARIAGAGERWETEGIEPEISASDRGILGKFSAALPAGCTMVVEKLVRIATSRDGDFEDGGGGENVEDLGLDAAGGNMQSGGWCAKGGNPEPGGSRAEGGNPAPTGSGAALRPRLMEREKQEMDHLRSRSWEAVFNDSADAWAALWQERDVAVRADDHFDQLSARFAVYHLTAMAPLHDNRMNIGAKGLSGRGYLGHTFWDTEIYMLPYYIWTDPAGARSLLEHRYHCLGAARRKAREKGYEGAMYPWQTAWLTDTETSVNQFMADFEHHVTADVAYGVHYYYEVTHDLDFMLRCGCEILFETAKFWFSRLEYDPQRDRFEIRGVIGPDEYTHEADNNAFTNYLARLNLELAVRWYGELRQRAPERFLQLEAELNLSGRPDAWRQAAARLYLPASNEAGILPQDDTFLSLPEIDLTPYRSGRRKLKQDFPNRSYKKLQVSKQADVVILFWLLEDLFSCEVKRNSFYYYEQRCVHDSSLSLCAYSILAADIGEQETAFALYRRACRIDLGEKMDSSDEGIHAASLGGIWQCVVIGFLGVRLYRGGLRVKPHLPDSWQEASARIVWRGQPMLVTADRRRLTIKALDKRPLPKVLTAGGLWGGGAAVYQEVYCDEP